MAFKNCVHSVIEILEVEGDTQFICFCSEVKAGSLLLLQPWKVALPEHL